jgi:hypothetical protein
MSLSAQVHVYHEEELHEGRHVKAGERREVADHVCRVYAACAYDRSECIGTWTLSAVQLYPCLLGDLLD